MGMWHRKAHRPAVSSAGHHCGWSLFSVCEPVSLLPASGASDAEWTRVPLRIPCYQPQTPELSPRLFLTFFDPCFYSDHTAKVIWKGRKFESGTCTSSVDLCFEKPNPAHSLSSPTGWVYVTNFMFYSSKHAEICLSLFTTILDFLLPLMNEWIIS